jgi:hypothetical protein
VDSQFIFSNNSLMVAVDCLGYGFMSVATFSLAFSFSKKKWLFISLLCHGLLAPFVVGAFFFPALLAIGALWMITLPFAMIMAMKFFKSGKVMGN